jgi:hypothetical protein
MDIGQLASGLATSPLSWMLAISLVVNAYLFKSLSTEKTDRLNMVITQESAHRETLTKILPLIEKLLAALNLVDKLSDTLTKGK